MIATRRSSRDVVGEKDLAHPAGAERGVDAVPAGEQLHGHLPSQKLFGEVGVRDHLERAKVRQRGFDHRSAARLVGGI